MLLIAITGGIGAGKSVVSRILRAMGYSVFDCDSEAKALMDVDKDIHRRLRSDINEAVVIDGAIDRALLSRLVFSDAELLRRLNAIVHTAVKERLTHWCSVQRGEVAFVETAILFQSGLNALVDAEWRVNAPEDLRVKRVMLRNSLTESEVRRRIAAQEFTPVAPVPPRKDIVNDGRLAVLPQVLTLLTTASIRSPRESVKP